MDKEIKKLEGCLAAMKKCLKIPKVETCICFSDAFKVLYLEADRLEKIAQATEFKERVMAIKDEIKKIRKNISSQDKECIGCDPCMAAVVFKAYPEVLNSLYTDNEL